MATSLTISILADVSKAVQGIDNVDKRTQSWGQNMKSAALSIGAAFSVDKIKGYVEGWVQSGLEANRAIRNVKGVFDEAATGVEKWADTTAASFGMTAAEAEMMAAKVGVALEGYGMSHKEAAKASEDLVQRSADIAKVLGVDQSEVLSKVETAMRGRTAGLKDYGVAVEKGASQTDIFNGFMTQTEKYAGQADTGLGNLHGTFGDLTAQLGQALIPILTDLIPLIQKVADWAKNNKTVFDAIVLVITALALVFGLAATAAGIFAVASLSALWPILLVVGAVAALVAIVVVVIKYWSDLVGWYHESVSAVGAFIDRFQVLLLLFGGPLGVAMVAIRNFKEIWGGVKSAIDAVVSVVEHLWDIVGKVAGAIGGVLSHVPGLGKSGGGAATAGAGVSAYGAAPLAAPVTFAPQITITGDVGDPMLAGRRIVAALETWTAANGRRRMSALIGNP